MDFTATVISSGLFEDLEEDSFDDMEDAADSLQELGDVSGKLADGAAQLLSGASTYHSEHRVGRFPPSPLRVRGSG